MSPRSARLKVAAPSPIAGYLVRLTAAWMALGLAGTIFLFLATQLLRIAPVFVGAALPPDTLAAAVLLLLVPVAGWGLTPSFLLALFAAAGTLAEHQELLAMDALGVSLAQRIKGLLALTLCLSALSALVWLYLAPMAEQRLIALAARAAEEALAGRLLPGRVSEPVPGLTFYAERRSGPRFENVFIADETGPGPRHIAARSAKIGTPVPGVLSFSLERGALFVDSEAPRTAGRGAGRRMAMSFDTLTVALPIRAEIERRLDFIPRQVAASTPALLGPPPPAIPLSLWRYTFWRRMTAPLGFFTLALLGMAIAYRTPWRSRGQALGVALLLFGAYHAAARWGEVLLQEGRLSPPAAAALPLLCLPILCGSGLLFLRLSQRRAKLGGRATRLFDSPK